MMNIQLHTINLEVADPQRSKRFYIDALGMTENEQRSHPSGFVYLESAGGNLTLATPQEATAAEPSRTMEIGFKTDDLASLQGRFAEQGIDGFKPQGIGWADVLEGHDPDGHRVIIYCFKKRIIQAGARWQLGGPEIEAAPKAMFPGRPTRCVLAASG